MITQPIPVKNPKNTNDVNRLEPIILKKLKDLYQLPEVAIRILNLMADPNLNVRKISEFIETNQEITSKVLKIANSAYYGMCGKITSIRHAAIVLGYKILGRY